MSGLGQPRGEIGETVANFPTYEGAQKAVSKLVASEVPARDIAIVGSGLRSVERVTGKLGYATAARQGAINGLLLGLFFSAIFVLGNSAVGVSVFVGVLFVGVALGMLLSIGAYAIVRRRRDFASVTQVIADHYEVTVLPTSIHRAREVLGATPTAPRAPAPSDEQPRYGQRAQPPAQDGRHDDEPPRFGQRVTQPQSQPQSQPPAEEQVQPTAEAQPEEPPRYGQRIADTPPEPAAAPDTDETTSDDGAQDADSRDRADAAPDDEPATPDDTRGDDDRTA